jgi:hypothetical protein
MNNPVVAQLDCHPEQAFFAQRGIWASRAKRRALCDAIIARLARFLIELSHERKYLTRAAIPFPMDPSNWHRVYLIYKERRFHEIYQKVRSCPHWRSSGRSFNTSFIRSQGRDLYRHG